jgi:hypothetical protein
MTKKPNIMQRMLINGATYLRTKMMPAKRKKKTMTTRIRLTLKQLQNCGKRSEIASTLR